MALVLVLVLLVLVMLLTLVLLARVAEMAEAAEMAELRNRWPMMIGESASAGWHPVPAGAAVDTQKQEGVRQQRRAQRQQ
jgi:hypothetical protein